MKVCILGLDDAGKTTVLYKLTLGEVVSTAPTIGSNVEVFQHKNLNIRLWDIGGQSALRQSWAQYYAKARAIILVVDSTDRERLPIVKSELHKMATDENLVGAAMLVLANKQDVRGCMNDVQISEGLDLTQLKDREWHIVACSALTGKGLAEGLDWLTLRLSRR
ncbi:MAG: hypothetical protein CYPHOPRED_002038 [Cyphobasidiales sp. Tagirdzhanova-0007]|nr:MAG: hypothetical protein CYPHOPRED_002038 [Cyphobasidiales sp. Tagirdzhanova-0007]